MGAAYRGIAFRSSFIFARLPASTYQAAPFQMVAGAEGENGRAIGCGILIFYFTNDSSLLETRHNSRDPWCRAFNALNVPTLIIYSFSSLKYTDVYVLYARMFLHVRIFTSFCCHTYGYNINFKF